MKKYFLNDGTGQQGPFDLDELRSKNITAETNVWYEGLPETTTAGQLDELKDFFTVSQPVVAPVEEIVVEEPVTPEPVVTTTATTVTTAAVATPVAATAAKAAVATKSTAWLSWVLTLLVLGGAGYFVYQDMEKNKAPGSSIGKTEATSDSTAANVPTTTQQGADTATSPVVTTDPADTAVTTSTTDPVTTTTTTTTSTNSANTAQQTAAQKAAAKKAEDEKKKQLALAAQKKAEAEKKKQLAAQAARELEMRNNWPRYISIGNLNYETKGDGVKAFDVPVYNGTDAMLDKVTVRVEYTKKNDKKIVKTENITVYNIPPRSTVNGKAPESKKGDKANVILTGMTSRKLHFCFPQNNGNASDPYYCN